jgi:ABC-2 type transport system ATP-binding protein
MTADPVLAAHGLGKRYGRRWALSECSLTVPAGRIVGLVGPNGAGKTTLLRLAVGLLTPSSGTVRVLGERPAAGPDQLGRVGFVAQDTPVYPNLSVADHLRLGAWLNRRWDGDGARRRIDQLGLDPRQRAGRLSGGQRAQLALTLAIAKRPELLILDEPVASLDPLARREFMQAIADVAVEQGVSVMLSSHLVSDLERACDFMIVLVASRVRLAGTVSDLLRGAGGRTLEDLVVDHMTLDHPGSRDLPGALDRSGTQHRAHTHPGALGGSATLDDPDPDQPGSVVRP